MANTPYQQLALITAEIRRLAESGAWENAAAIAAKLGPHVGAGSFPDATPADREAIEAALNDIAAIAERAIPLQEDMANLLRAFGPLAEKR